MTYITISTNAEAVAKDLDIKRRELRIVAEKSFKDTEKAVKKDIDGITHSWDHEVDVFVEVDTRGKEFEFLAGTDNSLFHWLNSGVKGRFIRPVRTKALRFMSGFRPKTTPGSLRSGAGGSFGSVVFSRGHWWPGIKPRNWIPKIQQRANKKAIHAFNKYLGQWAKKGRV